jgi:hypothetical protein
MTQMRLRPRSTAGIDRAWSRVTRVVDDAKALDRRVNRLGLVL